MIQKFIVFFKAYYNLSKGGISLSVALTTATGYLLSTGEFNEAVLYPFLGVLFLAMAASILNQVQERRADKIMPRTQNRPLLTHTISLRSSIILTLGFGIAGSVILYYFNGLLAASLGLVNLLWYNFVYTPLKYKTAFASFPGGLVGAIPPVIGWVAGGGELFHPTAMALALFFFIGQIPHFWLLVLRYSDEYKIAGMKPITDKFNSIQIKRLVLIWVIATALSGSILAYFMIIYHNSVFFLIQSFSLGLMLFFIMWYLRNSSDRSRKAFISINVYYLFIMIFIITDIITP